MEWIRGNTIGQGSSATVSVATKSGEVFAVKSVELSKSNILQREQKILSSIKSPHVVSYIDCDVTNEDGNLVYNLFMEYIAGGTLSTLIQNNGGCLKEASIRTHTHEILLGLDHLHMNGLVHCDIKGRNILMGPNGAKIADLGCSRMIGEEDGLGVMPISGTPVYMAPEVARGEDQGFPADVWALGCTVIEMATGRPPWPQVKNHVSALYRIGFSGDVPEFPSWLSEEGQDFLSKCLGRDAKDRWTIKELLEHPFVSLCTKETQVSTSNSPTSILDQDFWDSIEDSDVMRRLTQTGCSNSVVERVRKMACPVVPNWGASQDSWITIRTSQATISGSEMETSVSPVSEMDFNGDGNSTSESSKSRCSIGKKRGFEDICKCVDSSSNLNFETQRDFMFSFNTNSFTS